MDKEGVLSLAENVMEQNPGTLHSPEKYLAHLACTYDIAQETVRRILSHNPDLPLDEKEIAFAAGLHDIGRPLQENQLFHELRGWEYIKNHGVEVDISSSQEAVNRIAFMMHSHGFLYERWMEEDNAAARIEFEPIDTSVLVPRSWQEAIVTHADDNNADGIRVENPDERYRLLLEKYANDPVAQSILSGRARVRELCERVEAFASGQLSEAEIMIYGFLRSKSLASTLH